VARGQELNLGGPTRCALYPLELEIQIGTFHNFKCGEHIGTVIECGVE
jgi:hypothetical protein